MVAQLFRAELTKYCPWYAAIANYITHKYIPQEFNNQERKKLLADCKNYFWDEPYLFRRCADHVIRRCVDEVSSKAILEECHGGMVGGHHAANRTAFKLLQSGFYWPTIYKDAQ